MQRVSITPPPSNPVLLDELKDHLRIDHHEQDAILSLAIQEGTETVEQMTGCKLILQDWELRLEGWSTPLALDLAPLIEVLSISYINPLGVQTTLEASEYYVRHQFGRPLIYPKTNFPAIGDAAYPVTIKARVGFGDNGNAVPTTLRRSVMLLASDYFEGRPPNLMAVTDLISEHRAYVF